MSDCARFREQILDASVEELQGSAEVPLSLHIRACPGCAAAAKRILEANAALSEVLASAPPIDAAAIVARARLEAVPVEGAGSASAGGSDPAERPAGAEAEAIGAGRAPSPGRARRRASRAWRQWITVGAAASIGALLLLSRRDEPLPGVELAPREAAYATVEAPDDRNVAVIQTDNPDITVLWFF